MDFLVLLIISITIALYSPPSHHHHFHHCSFLVAWHYFMENSQAVTLSFRNCLSPVSLQSQIDDGIALHQSKQWVHTRTNCCQTLHLSTSGCSKQNWAQEVFCNPPANLWAEELGEQYLWFSLQEILQQFLQWLLHHWSWCLVLGFSRNIKTHKTTKC